jgi:hypothetical protein
MFFMSRRVPDASQRDCSEDSPPEPPTPSRDEVQRLLRRSRDDDPVPARAPSDDCSEGTRPCRESEFPVHAVSPWTTSTRLERLATLGTLFLVFGGVPYVLPVTPLVCVLAYILVRR